jgi:hypothetical protein
MRGKAARQGAQPFAAQGDVAGGEQERQRRPGVQEADHTDRAARRRSACTAAIASAKGGIMLAAPPQPPARP